MRQQDLQVFEAKLDESKTCLKKQTNYQTETDQQVSLRSTVASSPAGNPSRLFLTLSLTWVLLSNRHFSNVIISPDAQNIKLTTVTHNCTTALKEESGFENRVAYIHRKSYGKYQLLIIVNSF